MQNKLKQVYRRIRNLDEINRLERQLKQTEEDHHKFIRAYVHEAVKIINPMVGFSEMLLEDNLSETEKQEFAKIINSSAKKAANHLEILAMTKMTKKNLEQNSEMMSLGEILREEIDYGILNYLKEKKIAIEITDKTQKIYACPGAFRFILGTLGGNSLKWAPNGSIIKKYLETTNTDLIIRMENKSSRKPNTYKHGLDEGIGIPISEELIKTMGGQLNKYQKPQIASNSYQKERIGSIYAKDSLLEIYGIEIKIPLKNSEL